jgi:copper chaperone CopZ
MADKKFTFNTNINCASCKATIEKAFDGRDLYSELEVNFSDPKRPATFTARGGVSAEDIRAVIESAGYKAEQVKTGLFSKLFHKN